MSKVAGRCTVLCVEERTHLAIKNILLAAVLAEPSDAILSYAASLARHYGSKMSLTGAVSGGAICEIIRKGEIDLLVLGTPVQESRKSALDTAVEEILRRVPCPMLIIGPRVTETELAKGNLERIVYVTDYTTGSLDGLPYALALAHDHGAQVEFVHVAEETTMGPFHFGNPRIVTFRKKLERMAASGGALLRESEFAVQEGDRPQGMVRIATNLHASLIVLNARRIPNETAPYSLWPIAVKVLRLALCPVLIVGGPPRRTIFEGRLHE
jgi:nucleotide-binding universal stress UspA family protein